MRFQSTLWLHSGGSWWFVTVPPTLTDDIAEASGPRRGFGSVRVVATIGSTTWRTSVFPEAASGSFVLPVKKQVRVAEQLNDAAPVEVEIVVDNS